MVAGMGMNQMIKVPAERWTGQMIPEKLEQAVQEQINQGNKPFFVNSTMGSTVMGAFDDCHQISRICKKYGMWHHMDACWGGLFAFSDQTNYLFDGAHKADSVSFNPHKGLGVPMQCSYLITNNKKNALQAANSSGASYLFHESEYSKYDVSDKTLSCGRHADSLKLWLTFKRHGMTGMA